MRMLEILALQGCREFIFAAKGMENCTRLKEAFRFGKGFFSRLSIDEGKIKNPSANTSFQKAMFNLQRIN
jgi:hypothetical protein